MNELEMEIGRTFGASTFFIYQTIKHNPNVSAKDIAVETGLSETCIQAALVRLRESHVVKFTMSKYGNRKEIKYSDNEEKQSWKFH